MRLLHHIGKSEDRLTMLREFHRARTRTDIYQNRFVVPARQIEQELESAGFVVRGYSDFLPHYAMWRVFVLQKIATH